MAELGPEPQKANDVAAMMGRTSSNLAPTRAELINMGLLYTPEHGYAAFTVPQFDTFLRRAIPELVVPELRTRSRHPKPSDNKDEIQRLVSGASGGRDWAASADPVGMQVESCRIRRDTAQQRRSNTAGAVRGRTIHEVLRENPRTQAVVLHAVW